MNCDNTESKALVETATAIGRDLVNHVNSGAPSDSPLWDKHFDPKFLSVEGDGMSWEGRAKVQEKHDWWNSNMTVHSCKAEGPFVTVNGFSVFYKMDIEAKDGSFPRHTMTEIGVYAVKNDKVVREEFYNQAR